MPLEFTVAKRGENECYGKVLVEKATDKIVGMHICGIHAGEIIQGFALAVKYAPLQGPSTIMWLRASVHLLPFDEGLRCGQAGCHKGTAGQLGWHSPDEC